MDQSPSCEKTHAIRGNEIVECIRAGAFRISRNRGIQDGCLGVIRTGNARYPFRTDRRSLGIFHSMAGGVLPPPVGNEGCLAQLISSTAVWLLQSFAQMVKPADVERELNLRLPRFVRHEPHGFLFALVA
jgi:hypothetical protein